MTTIQKIAITYAIIANIVGLSVMGIDKRRAICHKWRIPEKTLFLVSILEFPIVKDTTPNMMNPRLYTTSYNKPQGQQFDDTAVLSFIKLQYT